MIVAIGCSSSSGSHFLSYLLNDHPQAACGDELYLYCKPLAYSDYGYLKKIARYIRRRGLSSNPYDSIRSFLIDVEAYQLDEDRVWEWVHAAADFPELARRFEAHVRELHGKEVWAEKAPQNVKLLGPFLAAFPAAKAIHIVRDPRDVVLSLVQRKRSMLEAAETWLTSVAAAQKHRKDPRVLEIRYEDLIRDREPTLEKVCRHLGIDFRMAYFLDEKHPSKGLRREVTHAGWQLKPGQGFSDKSIGKWKGREGELAPIFSMRLTPEYARLVDAPEVELADLAREYGYDVDPAHAAPFEGRVVALDKRSFKRRLRQFFYERVRYMPKVMV